MDEHPRGNRKVEGRVSTRGTAAGAKLGRTKGNNTGKLSTQNRKKRMGNQPRQKGKSLRNERTKGAPGSRCEENREESGKEEQDAE